MSDISERLLAIIAEKNISYGELSKLTKIPKSAIQRYATGETEKIPINRLEALASALGVSSAYLMGWAENTDDILRKRQHDEINEIFDKMPPELRAHAIALLKGLTLQAGSQDDPAGSD